MTGCERCGTTEREVEHSEELGVTLCGDCFAARADAAQIMARAKKHAPTVLALMPEDGRPQDERNDEALRIALGNARAERFWAEREAADGREPEGQDGGDGSTWEPVDIAPILAGEGNLEPAPTMLARTDGRRLIYRAKVHSFNGEPECGKGWLALLAVAERIDADEHAAYIDFEDEAAVAVDRLRALGVDDDAISERFHYIRPDEPLDDVGRREIEILHKLPITLAVIDGLTDALAIHGIDLRDNTEVANGMRDLPHGLRRRGASVIVNDHVTKDSESRGRYAIGAQHKLAKVDVSYSLQAKEPLGRGLEGRVVIRVTKDRPGHVRSLAKNKIVAEMIAVSLPGGAMDLGPEAPSDEAEGPFRLTSFMRKISRAVEDTPGLGVVALRAAVGGKAQYVDLARELLISEGYVEERKRRSVTSRSDPSRRKTDEGSLQLCPEYVPNLSRACPGCPRKAPCPPVPTYRGQGTGATVAPCPNCVPGRGHVAGGDRWVTAYQPRPVQRGQSTVSSSSATSSITPSPHIASRSPSSTPTGTRSTPTTTTRA